jgi:hypothetical protein
LRDPEDATYRDRVCVRRRSTGNIKQVEAVNNRVVVAVLRKVFCSNQWASIITGGKKFADGWEDVASGETMAVTEIKAWDE